VPVLLQSFAPRKDPLTAMQIPATGCPVLASVALTVMMPDGRSTSFSVTVRPTSTLTRSALAEVVLPVAHCTWLNR
jgi:hypothetical protein